MFVSQTVGDFEKRLGAQSSTPQAVAVSNVKVEGDHLNITLDSAINTSFDTIMTTADVNVVLSTHGKTIANDVLGSSGASKSFLSFAIKKSQVTFVPKAGAKWNLP